MPLFKKGKNKVRGGESVNIAVTTEDGFLVSVPMHSRQTVFDLRKETAKMVKVFPKDLILLMHGAPLEDSLVLEDTDAVQNDDVVVMKLHQPMMSIRPMPAVMNPLTQLAAINPMLYSQLVQMHPGLARGPGGPVMGGPAQLPPGHAGASGGQGFDVAAPPPQLVAEQRAIESMIQRQRRAGDLERALAEIPEAFTSVGSLNVHLDINGHEVRAIVDTGAQATTMTFACAERCGLVEAGKVDDRFRGIVYGVTGSTEIIGKIVFQEVKIGKGKHPINCSFTVIAGGMGDTEVLVGLDTLLRNSAVLDLRPGKRTITLGKDTISLVLSDGDTSGAGTSRQD